MRLGILADIHGNADALEAVLSSAQRMGIDRLLICGDFVGYYYEPARVMSQLAPWVWAGVRGNHEEMVGRALSSIAEMERLTQRYGHGLSVAAKTLKDGDRDMLLSLPETRRLTFENVTATICHGAPWDNNAYVYPDAEPGVFARLVETGTDLVCFGHTHHPMVKTVDQTILLNPGSVGQPRDGRPGACWASFDCNSKHVELHRESYDAGNVLDQCRRFDPGLPNLQKYF